MSQITRRKFWIILYPKITSIAYFRSPSEKTLRPKPQRCLRPLLTENLKRQQLFHVLSASKPKRRHRKRIHIAKDP